jgi:Protein of unknown function (DUF3301)
MWETAALVVLVASVLLWLDSLRARERALGAGRAACRRYGLQFLDETVAISRIRLRRDDEGRVKIARTYTFEFTETGNTRRQGAVVMLGQQLSDVQMEPYTVQ